MIKSSRYSIPTAFFLSLVFLPACFAMGSKRVDLSGQYQLKYPCIDKNGKYSRLALPRPEPLLQESSHVLTAFENFPLEIFQNLDSKQTDISYMIHTPNHPTPILTRVTPGNIKQVDGKRMGRKVKWNDEVLEISDCHVLDFDFPGVDETSYDCYEWSFSKGPQESLKVQFRNRVGGKSKGEDASEVVMEERHCNLPRI